MRLAPNRRVLLSSRTSYVLCLTTVRVVRLTMTERARACLHAALKT